VPATAAIPKLVQWTFAAFAAALSFDNTGVSLAEDFSLAKFAAIIFVGSYFLYHNPLFGKRPFPPLPAPLWCFGGLAVLYLLNGVLQGQLVQTPIFTLAQLLLFFWVASSLLQNDAMAHTVVTTFAFTSAALAVGTLLELPGFSTSLRSTVGERISSLDANPSVLAFNLALAATILIGLNLDTRVRPLWNRILVMVSILPLMVVIVRTGARSGLVAVLAGSLAYLMAVRHSAVKFRAVILAVLVFGSFLYLMTLYPALFNRVLLTYDETQGGAPEYREIFFYEALKMFTERPVLGNLAYTEEFGIRTGLYNSTGFVPTDTHNTFLHILLELGLVGAVFFVLGFWLCLRSAWKGRSGNLGMLPLALLMATLVMNLVNTEHLTKSVWLVLALSTAAAPKREKRLFVLVRQSLARTT